MGTTFDPDILNRWASLGKNARLSQQPSVDRLAVRRMITVTRPVLQANREEAKRLIEQSNSFLSPFKDPFEMDFGLHRCLQKDREEAYSDWLAWIVRQLRTPEQIIKLFLTDDSNTLLTKCKGKELYIRRENIRGGIEGQRRTDIEIIFGDQDAILVEVKLIDADDVDLQQLRDQANYSPGFAHRLLLAPSGAADTDLGEFKLLLWQDLCIRLREVIPELSRENLTAGAMVLAFVGAVEQNILGFPGELKHKLQRGQFVNTAMLDYLTMCAKKGEKLCQKEKSSKI